MALLQPCDILVSTVEHYAQWLRPSAAFIQLGASNLSAGVPSSPNPATGSSSRHYRLHVPTAERLTGRSGRRTSLAADASAFSAAFASATLHTVWRWPCAACAQKSAVQRRRCRESTTPPAQRAPAHVQTGGTAGSRVAVCIVGQLSRLELESKRANLLLPTAAVRPSALHVFLALERNSHVYSNLDFGAILAQQQPSCTRDVEIDTVR